MLNRLLYSKLVTESLITKRPLKVSHISTDLIKFAKANKILYLLGLYDKRIQAFSNWQKLKIRREEQKKAMAEVSTLAEKYHIDLMVVKTIKSFEYVPDDIDLLIINDDLIDIFINKLIERGYFLRKKGTPEITLRKIIGDTFIDLDIHTKLGAGTYEYIDKYYLWKRRVYMIINDTKIIIPNVVDEFLITVAHATMKELIFTIADIMHVISLSKKVREKAVKQAKKIGLLKAVKYIMDLTDKTLNMILENPYKYVKITYPYRIPTPIIMEIYLENFAHRLKARGLLPLKEIIKIPSSKGIGILLRYLGL